MTRDSFVNFMISTYCVDVCFIGDFENVGVACDTYAMSAARLRWTQPHIKTRGGVIIAYSSVIMIPFISLVVFTIAYVTTSFGHPKPDSLLDRYTSIDTRKSRQSLTPSLSATLQQTLNNLKSDRKTDLFSRMEVSLCGHRAQTLDPSDLTAMVQRLKDQRGVGIADLLRAFFSGLFSKQNQKLQVVPTRASDESRI